MSPKKHTPPPRRPTRQPRHEAPEPEHENPEPEQENPEPEQENPGPEHENPEPEHENPEPQQEVPAPEQNLAPQLLTADSNWYQKFQFGGTMPAVVMDFINSMYWNGTTTLSSPSTLLSNTAIVANKGLDCTSANPNAANMQAAGALLGAFQGGAFTLMVATNNMNAPTGDVAAVSGASNGTTPTDLYLEYGSDTHAKCYQQSGNSFLLTASPSPLSFNLISSVTSAAGAYRAINVGQGENERDTHPFASNPALVFVGGATAGFPAAALNGYIGYLAVDQIAASNVAYTALPAFTGPNGWWLGSGGNAGITYGNVLTYEYTQPWTVIAAICIVASPTNPVTTANGVVFSTSKNSPFPGYEIWIPGTNVIGVRIISDFGGGFYLGKYGSTNLVDQKWHVVAATYDGSGLASGVNLYVDGVLETATVEHDGLAGHSIIGPAGNNSYTIGNQASATLPLAGAVGLFRQYNVVKPLSFIQQFTNIFSQNQQVPAIDATCVLAPRLSEGAPSTTTGDLSASNLTGTFIAGSAWLRGASPSVTPPAAPTGLTATAISSSQINLSWTASSGATSYIVLRGGTQVGTPTTTTFSDTGLASSTNYTYTVQAVNAGGTSAASASASAMTFPGGVAPAAPTGLTANPISSSQINLSWTPSSGATSYIVLRGGTQVGTPVAPSFANTGLAASTSYTYTVEAVNAGGTSAPSASASATTFATGGGVFPLFTPLIPPPLIGQGGGPPPTFPPISGATPVPIPPGVLIGPAITLPTAIPGKALIIFGTGSATTPAVTSWFPSFTTTFPSPTFVVSNVWTVPTLAGGVWTSTLPARTATTQNIPIGGWGLPGPSGSGPGPPTYPNPPGAGLPHS